MNTPNSKPPLDPTPAFETLVLATQDLLERFREQLAALPQHKTGVTRETLWQQVGRMTEVNCHLGKAARALTRATNVAHAANSSA